MIWALKAMHDKGIIHRDIKPHNFCMTHPMNFGSVSNPNHIYIIDFGLSKFYRNNNQHIDYLDGLALCGTAKYCSLATHQGVT